METDVLIVGAGLSGLALALDLQRAGRDYILVEARDRIGGRIKSLAADAASGNAPRYDLGPAWFWPGQPRMAQFVRDFDLAVFEQYSTGSLVFEDANGAIQRDLAFATMAGSLRLENGMASLTEAIAAALQNDKIHLRSQVQHVTLAAHRVDVTIQGVSEKIHARHIAIAVPPRVATRTIAFDPVLTPLQSAAMAAVPTWMAGQAKVVAIYNQPFWRAAGLSGDGISRRGPLVEIHDASPSSGEQGALFGFVGTSPQARAKPDFDLAAQAVKQLTAMFGASAGNPVNVLIKDWAQDTFTATNADRDGDTAHSLYGLPGELRDLWEGRIVFASTEMGSQFGGYLEGALEAAHTAKGFLNINKSDVRLLS